MDKFKFCWVWILIAVFVVFCIYGFWPRLNVKDAYPLIGKKYLTIKSVFNDFGQPLWDGSAYFNNSYQRGYVYAERYIFPKTLLVIYGDDSNGTVLRSVSEPLQKQMFYFPRKSPFVILNYIEFMLKSKFDPKSSLEMQNTIKRLFPDDGGEVLRKLKEKWNNKKTK